MADKKISELDALTESASTDDFVVVDTSAGTTKKITYDNALGGASKTELGYVSGVTSAIQTQIDGKQDVLSEGAFTDGDKTKLDSVETNADATDATNVASAGAVMNTGDETIAGVKTFSSSPIVPAPTTDLQTATKKYVDDNAGGAPEGTAVKSTGETGGVKFLREDGDGTCSWQTPAGSGDMTKAVYDPTTVNGDAFDMDNMVEGTAKILTDAERTKLTGIETGAEVNNISDVNATDLTDSGDSSLHYHSTDRNRANHTGTQTASTISDFDTEVANNSAVAANTAKTGVTTEISNVSEDTTPQLGGELDAQAHSIGFTLTDNGNSGTAKTIDWGNSNKQKITLTGNCTFTFTAPAKPGAFQLIVAQDATGSRTATFPATVKWAGGTAPTLSTGASAVDIISFLYDGTNYYATSSLDFS